MSSNNIDIDSSNIDSSNINQNKKEVSQCKNTHTN